MKSLVLYASVALAFADLAAGDTLYVPAGDWMVPGNISVPASWVKIEGRGQFVKDPAAGVSPMFLLPDGVNNVIWSGVRFKGNRQSFSDGQPVPAVLGHRNSHITFENCEFTNLCDVGIKLRQTFALRVVDCKFSDISESGVETRWYENDPRTGQPWTWLPAGAGGVSVSYCVFENIGRFEDITQGTTLVDGCGFTADNTQSSRVVYNINFLHNTVRDVLRGFFTENANNFVRNVQVQFNHIVGTGAPGVYTRAGIGIIGVDGFNVSFNYIRDIGNHEAVGTSREGIVISGTSRNGRIHDNNIMDSRSSSIRMQRGIHLFQAQNVRVYDNDVSNASVENIVYVPSQCSELYIYANRGGSPSQSWCDTYEVEYYVENVQAGLGAGSLKPSGWTSDPNTAHVEQCAIVAVSYRLTRPITAGSLTIAPYVQGNAVSALQVTTGDFSGQYAGKKLATSAAPMVATLAGIAVRYNASNNFVASDSSGSGTGLYVKILFDRSRKL